MTHIDEDYSKILPIAVMVRAMDNSKQGDNGQQEACLALSLLTCSQGMETPSRGHPSSTVITENHLFSAIYY